MNVKEITQSILAVLIVGGAMFASLANNIDGTQYLIGIAGMVVGYYFKDVAVALGRKFKK